MSDAITLAPGLVLNGFVLGLTLIAAIGAQNAFVIRQGLRRQAHLVVALTCGVSDALLIVLGVFAVAVIQGPLPQIKSLLLWGGLLFLTVYGVRSVVAAFRSRDSLSVHGTASGSPTGRRRLVMTALAFSLLNPHAILDTVVIIGGYAAPYTTVGKASFALGAICASFAWFVMLAFGASRLAPILSRPRAWRAIELITGVTMLVLAVNLAREVT